ncbi:MAG: hypothetical protein RQ745_01010 [Longimicrobiales bacterium]|nr:hypothetical protein [Longimicrobiales bacterium]
MTIGSFIPLYRNLQMRTSILRRALSGGAFLLFLSLLLLSACGGDSGTTGGLGGEDVALAWSIEPAYTLGGSEAISWDAFGEVGGVGFDDAGNLYVLDTQSVRISVVAPDGTLVRSVGTRGEGPGELQRPESLVVFPDGSLAVYDFGKFGWVKYDARGEWIEDVTPDDLSSLQLLGNFTRADATTVFAEVMGQIRMSNNPGAADADTEPEPEGDPIVRVPLDGSADPTVVFRAWEPPEPEGPEREVSGTSGPGNQMVIRMAPLRAFEPDLHFAGLPDGGFAALDSTTYRVGIFDASGALVREIERPVPPIPVTLAIKEAQRALLLAEQEEHERSGDQSGSVRIIGIGASNVQLDGMNEMMRNRIETMSFFPEIPAVSGLATDWEGRLWIERASGEPGVEGPTDVVTVEGNYLGTLPADALRTPDAFGPDGLAVWIETDDFDAARIVVGRIAEGAAGGTS